MPRGRRRLYYAFSPAAGWRVLVLDSYDVSLLAHEPGSDAHTATLGLLQTANRLPEEGKRTRSPASTRFAALWYRQRRPRRRPSRRFGAQLGGAEDRGNGREIGALPPERLQPPRGRTSSCAKAQAIVDAHWATVAAWISGADGDGGYARDAHEILCTT